MRYSKQLPVTRILIFVSMFFLAFSAFAEKKAPESIDGTKRVQREERTAMEGLVEKLLSKAVGIKGAPI